jgi:hypothetical protein
VEFLSGFEANSFTRSNAYFSAGSGIAANAGLAGPYAENPKSAQLNALPGGEGLLQTFEDRINRGLRLGPWQAGALNHVMNNVLLNQRGTSLQRIGRLSNDLR